MIHPFVLVPLSLELVIFASYVHDDHLFGKHYSMKHILLLTFLGCYMTKEFFKNIFGLLSIQKYVATFCLLPYGIVVNVINEYIGGRGKPLNF
jgi:hypothetical protein